MPDVLLVDDDYDLYGNFQADYTAAMNALPLSPHNYPVTYDVWDVYAVMQQAEPDYAALALYKKVVWWSGREDFYAGPTDLGEMNLTKWLDRRGDMRTYVYRMQSGENAPPLVGEFSLEVDASDAGAGAYRAGMGFLVAVGVIFVVGVLMRAYLVRQIFRWAERLLLEIPLVKSIYGAIRDFFGLFAGGEDAKSLRVVSVSLPGVILLAMK